MLSYLKKLFHHEKPRTRKTATVSGTVEFLETSRVVTLFIFLATTAAIVLISFVGVSTVNLPVLPNQLASVRITASASFSFESKEKTRVAVEQMRDRVPPVYRLDFESLQQFERLIATTLCLRPRIKRKCLRALAGDRYRQIFGRREINEQLRNLKRPRDTEPRDISWRPPSDIHAVERDRAGVGLEIAGD